MDSRESRRSAKVLARLQVELLFQRNRFRSRSCLYTEVRKLMARSYASAFGPEKVSAPERGIKEMGKDEYDKYIKQIEAQQALIKAGYSGIKEKIKTLRGKNIAKRWTKRREAGVVDNRYVNDNPHNWKAAARDEREMTIVFTTRLFRRSAIFVCVVGFGVQSPLLELFALDPMGEGAPPCENFSCRTTVSLTLQGRVPLNRP